MKYFPFVRTERRSGLSPRRLNTEMSRWMALRWGAGSRRAAPRRRHTLHAALVTETLVGEQPKGMEMQHKTSQGKFTTAPVSGGTAATAQP